MSNKKTKTAITKKTEQLPTHAALLNSKKQTKKHFEVKKTAVNCTSAISKTYIKINNKESL